MNVCFTVNFELPCDPHHLRQLATTTSNFIRCQFYLKKEVLPEVYKIRLISSPHAAQVLRGSMMVLAGEEVVMVVAAGQIVATVGAKAAAAD